MTSRVPPSACLSCCYSVIGVCDSTDADMGSLGIVLLHLTGVESINAKSEL